MWGLSSRLLGGRNLHPLLRLTMLLIEDFQYYSCLSYFSRTACQIISGFPGPFTLRQTFKFNSSITVCSHNTERFIGVGSNVVDGASCARVSVCLASPDVVIPVNAGQAGVTALAGMLASFCVSNGAKRIEMGRGNGHRRRGGDRSAFRHGLRRWEWPFWQFCWQSFQNCWPQADGFLDQQELIER